MIRRTLALAVITLALASAACGGGKEREVKGTVIIALTAEEVLEVIKAHVGLDKGEAFINRATEDRQSCPGLPSNKDDLLGTEVVIRNADRKTIAVTRLRLGKLTITEDGESACHLTFEVQVKPSDFYEVELGDDLGRETVRGEELDSGDAEVVFRLG
jgi:hypothetical protein